MPNVIIPTNHPDAHSPLLWLAAQALARMGARVEIATDGENLVRRLHAAEDDADVRERTDAPIAVVQAQGLPNLLHELVHAVQVGHLDDDHGVDYGAIPFPLDQRSGRAALWDELSCCVISCAYLWAQGRAARANAAAARVDDEVDHWFREQVEIQPVFYGMEHEPAAFDARVRSLLDEHGAEACAVLERAYVATERALVDAGGDPELARPPRRPSIRAMWRRTERV